MRRPCNHPGCPTLIDKGQRCDKHEGIAPKRHTIYDRHVRAKDQSLAMAQKIRSSVRWQKVRRLQLSEFPLCQDPFGEHFRRGMTETATQVHHIRGLATNPELAFHRENLMSVCTGCHARIEREVRQGGSDDS